ncbi:MAG: hypothetical protein IKQ45_03715 [Clostridia bacterium]|nr:hypothetical protein [Clostridia bacterium]
MMKRITGILVCLLLAILCTAAMADVKIDEEHFPDPTFRSFLELRFDKNHDGVLSESEIREATWVHISGE